MSSHKQVSEEHAYLTNNFLDILLGILVYTYPFKDSIEISIDRPRGFVVSEIVNSVDIKNIVDSYSNGNTVVSPNDSRYIYIVKKINIDSLSLCRILEKALRCSKCETLGLKDSDAIAYQTVILYSCKNIERYLKLNVREATIEALLWDIGKGVLIHNGNKFELLIRIEYSYKDDFYWRLKLMEKYDNLLLNFFGYQRFGSRRPISHLIGKHIVKNYWEKAFELLCNYPFPTESSASIRRRIKWLYADEPLGNHSFLGVENACIYRHENPLNIIKCLPKEIVIFFINAYQSYLFNILLSRLWMKLIAYHDLPKALEILRREYRYLPILGSQTICFKPEIREIIDEVLEIEDIDQKSFCINDLRICEKGSYRESLTKVYDVSHNDINGYIKLSFALPPGSYATIVIRDIARCNPILYT